MDRRGRWWFGITALAVLVGVVLQVVVAATSPPPNRFGPVGRSLNVLAFFTVQSNLIVGATSILLFVDRRRSSTAFKVARLTGVVAIAITFVVFHVALAELLDLEGWAFVADRLLHLIVPVLAVVGWLIVGPRGLTSRRVVWLSLLFPVAWCVFTLVRGAIIDWYPYPFIDVTELGYAEVLVNCGWVAVLYVGVAAGLHALDGWLQRVGGTAAERAIERDP
jgi:hypothetical protein